MTFIKDWFRHEDNKTGCRFIVVDAYNEERVLKYYDKNGFLPLYKTEEIEKQYYDIPQDAPLKTRLPYKGLIMAEFDRNGLGIIIRGRFLCAYYAVAKCGHKVQVI